MNEKQVGILFMCIGTGLLFLSEIVHEPDEVHLQDVNEDHLNSIIMFKGRISSLTSTESISFLEFESRSELDVVSFGDVDGVSEGDGVKVVGTVEMYQGELQIVAEEVELKK